MKKILFFLFLFSQFAGLAQDIYVLKPDRVFDGKEMHNGWAVLIKNDKIEAAGPVNQLTVIPGTKTIELAGQTLLPGLIEGHSHLFLHPYNETSWDDQVLNESRAERTARAVVHANKTLMAGFTTVRDLGTEGAGYDDVGLKQSIDKGIIPGPRVITAGPAIVASGSYGPRSNNANLNLIKGAEEADDNNLISTVRNQIGHGVDLIKIYADYSWGINNSQQATFTVEEIRKVVETAKSSGRPVVAHASTVEGMRRAITGGVETIEHGDEGTPEIFKLMKEKNVSFCPTLAAGDAMLQYRGWKKDSQQEPDRIKEKRESFQAAIKAGVTICMGGDVGVYTHGDNVREMKLMVEYGMSPIDVLKSATSVNADVFHIGNKVGRIKPGLLADLMSVPGNPLENIGIISDVKLVIKNGIIVRHD
jgi:imidazolonepropionase-like amidohydrolase